MFRRLFQFSLRETEAPLAAQHQNGSNGHCSEMVELANALQRESEKTAADDRPAVSVFDSFEQVYATAGVKTAGKAYTILKVAEMVSSKHLSDMTAEAKRSSLLMALEAAAAEIGDLLQDAVARQRALNDYEEERQNKLKEFEGFKSEENNRLAAELERLTGQYMSRIQANSDEVAQEQDNFRAWQKRKQAESQRITDAATFCVPQGNGANGNGGGLSVVLERVTVPRR